MVYEIAAYRLELSERICVSVGGQKSFRTFLASDQSSPTNLHCVDGSPELMPACDELQYSFDYEDVSCEFRAGSDSYMLVLKPLGKESLYMWKKTGSESAFFYGNYEAYLLSFALWLAFGLLTCKNTTVAIHSSCIVYNGKAVLFLGESGTGKSTHTRLWRENIYGAFLLNDDSPIIRSVDGKLRVFGSPWSGKTACYRQENYELAACVRLSQAPVNGIKKLNVLHSYAALLPSCPPQFAYDGVLSAMVNKMIDAILQVVPCYHLACLPDSYAAELACKTVFG